MATTTKTLNVYQKVAAIRKEIPVLAKNGVGPKTQGSYKFLSIDDILAAVKPIEDKYGVAVILLDGEIRFHYNVGQVPTDGRAPTEKVQGYGSFIFQVINTEADDPSEDSFVITVPAEGGDNGDKATRKTVTQAQKIAYITLYNIITGEPDPDATDGANGPGESAPSAPPAVAKAQGAKVSGSREQVKAEFIDTKKKTVAEVNAVKTAVEKETDLKGDDLYAEILNRLRAA